MRFHFRDDRGATAIEYAIIAALIGIGLIGSLVTTRGSISSIFGVASSNMASANAGGGGAAQSAAVAYWQAKGTPVKTVDPSYASGTYTRTTWTYPDGSTVTNSVNNGTNYNPTVEATDKATGTYSGYRPSTAARPDGIFVYSVGNTTQSWVKINPDGSYTDRSTGQPITDDVTKRTGYADIVALYGYYGTNP